ncbi:MAG: hypothetical protein IPN26_14850 [Bacteroidetes bacterium]|nr:hypothetical protein [Bacteroidota bacterium]
MEYYLSELCKFRKFKYRNNRPQTVVSLQRVWLAGGNNFSTSGTGYSFGTISNDHIDVRTNNVIRGRFTNLGEFYWGALATAISRRYD